MIINKFWLVEIKAQFDLHGQKRTGALHSAELLSRVTLSTCVKFAGLRYTSEMMLLSMNDWKDISISWTKLSQWFKSQITDTTNAIALFRVLKILTVRSTQLLWLAGWVLYHSCGFGFLGFSVCFLFFLKNHSTINYLQWLREATFTYCQLEISFYLTFWCVPTTFQL